MLNYYLMIDILNRGEGQATDVLVIKSFAGVCYWNYLFRKHERYVKKNFQGSKVNLESLNNNEISEICDYITQEIKKWTLKGVCRKSDLMIHSFRYLVVFGGKKVIVTSTQRTELNSRRNKVAMVWLKSQWSKRNWWN